MKIKPKLKNNTYKKDDVIASSFIFLKIIDKLSFIYIIYFHKFINFVIIISITKGKSENEKHNYRQRCHERS